MAICKFRTPSTPYRRLAQLQHRRRTALADQPQNPGSHARPSGLNARVWVVWLPGYIDAPAPTECEAPKIILGVKVSRRCARLINGQLPDDVSGPAVPARVHGRVPVAVVVTVLANVAHVTTPDTCLSVRACAADPATDTAGTDCTDATAWPQHRNSYTVWRPAKSRLGLRYGLDAGNFSLHGSHNKRNHRRPVLQI